jgi:hypothetical protein
MTYRRVVSSWMVAANGSKVPSGLKASLASHQLAATISSMADDFTRSWCPWRAAALVTQPMWKEGWPCMWG